MLLFKKIRIVFGCLFLATVFFVSCGKKSESITLAGSTAFQPFAEKIAEEYMNKNAGENINVQGGGSSAGIQSAISGTANIGMADLVTLPKETDVLKKFIVARDGIVIVVNPTNPVENLTTEQLQKIFSGEIKNWQEIGGEDKTITVISREEGSGTRSSFEKLTFKDKNLSANAIIQDSNGTLRENVSSDTQAIGYISYGIINEKIKVLKLDGVAPTQEALKNGEYKLVRPIYLLTKEEPTGLSKKYIDFVLGSEGQKILEASGLIAVR